MLLHLTLLLLSPAGLDISAQESFQNRKFKVLQEAGQRHMDLGIWCRDRGLIPQATAEFIQAVEVSENQHYGARTVLSYMRRLDDAFWKKRFNKPGSSLISGYEKKAHKLALKDQKERLDLAAWALKHDYEKEAWDEYMRILEQENAALDFDSSGRIKLAAGTIPKSIAFQVRQQAVEINGLWYLRDAFLQHIPSLTSIRQIETKQLRLRSAKETEQLQDYFDVALALLPKLEEALAGRPTHRLNIFIFETAENYRAFLNANGLVKFVKLPGLAQHRTHTAIVCAENLSKERVEAILLHELTHVYSHAISRANMPSWYEEGLAETFGGQATYEWDGKKLEVGGELASFLLDSLKDPQKRFPLSKLFRGNAVDIHAEGGDKAIRFYTQSWALLRYLREHASPSIRSQFQRWERICHGAALGAEIGNRQGTNRQPAQDLFMEMLGKDLPAIESGFFDYLDELLDS